jgi:hypothetical protein
MNMPGFNAEASLYKTGKHYHAAIEGGHVSGHVYPAQMVVPYKPYPVVDPNPLGLYCWRCRWEPVPYLPYRVPICGIELC